MIELKPVIFTEKQFDKIYAGIELTPEELKEINQKTSLFATFISSLILWIPFVILFLITKNNLWMALAVSLSGIILATTVTERNQQKLLKATEKFILTELQCSGYVPHRTISDQDEGNLNAEQISKRNIQKDQEVVKNNQLLVFLSDEFKEIRKQYQKGEKKRTLQEFQNQTEQTENIKSGKTSEKKKNKKIQESEE